LCRSRRKRAAESTLRLLSKKLSKQTPSLFLLILAGSIEQQAEVTATVTLPAQLRVEGIIKLA
jgi:hypothetical protein